MSLARPSSPPEWSSLMSGMTGMTGMTGDDMSSLAADDLLPPSRPRQGNNDVDGDDDMEDTIDAYGSTSTNRQSQQFHQSQQKQQQQQQQQRPLIDDHDSVIRLSEGSTYASSSAANVHGDDLRRYLQRSATGSQATNLENLTIGGGGSSSGDVFRSSFASSTSTIKGAGAAAAAATNAATISTSARAAAAAATAPQQTHRFHDDEDDYDEGSVDLGLYRRSHSREGSVSSQTSFTSHASSFDRDFASLKARYRKIVATLESTS